MNGYVAALAFIGAAMADGVGHSSSGSGYAAPASSYASPSNDYAAPQASYGAPSYEQPAQTYEEPSASYGYEQEYAPSYSAEGAVLDSAGFDLDKITELIPLFIAVFAAIIIAQLVAPLFATLFGAKVTLLSGIFGPLVGAKVGVINAILNPFDLGLCNAACNAAATPRNARSLSDIDVLDMIDIAQNMYNAI
jgi:hypothetical protein